MPSRCDEAVEAHAAFDLQDITEVDHGATTYWTKQQWLSFSPRQQFLLRLIRDPFVFFSIVPVGVFVLFFRVPRYCQTMHRLTCCLSCSHVHISLTIAFTTAYTLNKPYGPDSSFIAISIDKISEGTLQMGCCNTGYARAAGLIESQALLSPIGSS